MVKLLRKLHTYVGLLNFTILVIFGIAGLYVTMRGDPRETTKQPDRVRTVDFDPPADQSDYDVAQLAYQHFGNKTAAAPQFHRRNASNQLEFEFYGPNGTEHLTVIEAEQKLRIESFDASTPEFLTRMHTMNFKFGSYSLPLKLWGVYVELSMLSLLFMTITGVYLWLAARRKVRWAWATAAASSVLAVALYVAMR